MKCEAYREVKLLQHGMKIVERVLEKRRALVEVDNMQFGFMPRRTAIDTLFKVRKMQDKYREDKKLYISCGFRESLC